MKPKLRLNVVGDTFTHFAGGNKGYSVHGKVSKHIEWVKDGGEATFYTDTTLPWAWIDPKPGPKYAWLLESKYISPQIVDAVKMNTQQYLDTFDVIFTHNQELLALHPKFKWVPAQGFWIKEPKIYEKSKMISMISSNKRMCQGHIDRLEWVEALRDQVDLFGRGFKEIELKEEGLCDYMFSVAIENGQYGTYFTEKLLDCFATGTIPIYLGAPDIGKFFNMDGIIPLSDDFTVSKDIYESKKEAIQDNLEIAKTMEVTEDFIYTTYLN